jgi:hypothetical protein
MHFSDTKKLRLGGTYGDALELERIVLLQWVRHVGIQFTTAWSRIGENKKGNGLVGKTR